MASQKRLSSRKSIGYLPSPNLDIETGDKENVGPDSLLGEVATIVTNAKQNKSRSKSLGPGGLDALKEDAGNKRKIAVMLPKSILKPTIPLSPLREIPTRKQTNPAKSPVAAASPKKPAENSPSKKALNTASPHDAMKVLPKKLQARQQEDQVAESPQKATQAEGAQERQKQRDVIQKQREARRKSMANRRVSFAPEATLHTFDNLEDLQDSTTSSASTNSTRRASQISPRIVGVASPSNGSPSTPTKQVEDATSESSPAHQRDLHQNKRRRSSGIPPMNFNDPEDAFSSSPSNVGDETTVDAMGDAIDQGRFDSVSDLGESGSPSDLINVHDNTGKNDAQKADHVSQQNLDNNLGDEGEESGNTMEIAGDDVTAAFQPWVQQLSRASQSAARYTSSLDQENVNPFSPAFRLSQEQSARASPASSVQDQGDMSMDITRAIGGIVRSPIKTLTSSQPSPKRRKSVAARRRSSGASPTLEEDGTMNFTTAIGGIHSNGVENQDLDENEDLSMEFTSVFGGIQNRRKSELPDQQVQSEVLQTVDEEHPDEIEDDDGNMEMTTALGNIVQRSKDEEETGQMGMTKAVVGITQPNPARPGHMMETLASSAKSSPKKPPTHRSTTPQPRPATSISATGSPALSAPRSRGRARKLDSTIHFETAPRGAKTPPDQMTPQPPRPTTPEKTPPPNIAMRHPSPKRLFQIEIKQARASPAQGRPALVNRNDLIGGHTPEVKLMPKVQSRRQSSGVGFDKEGLGSPLVAALLDRRLSIGEHADAFAPQEARSRAVRFQDPRAMEAELARERDEDERRESAQFILQHEADEVDLGENDATLTLKEAIGNMTPKKGSSKSAKGRKSLAVGSGRGLLGKRPLELDDEEEDGTPNAFKGLDASPMKKIRLQAPPSASETTRRMFRQRLGPITDSDRPTTPTGASLIKKSASTPRHSGYFKDTEALPSAQKPLPVLGQASEMQDPKLSAEDDEQKIGLQDFLNMTSIRFMELNTTKRRHTVAPNAGRGFGDQNGLGEQDAAKRFENAVIAGACTLPMLELYQHSCRELKKYISEGRKIVREIEISTSEENPQLFREYLSAAPAARSVMDNQFKNMKTHARHLSKGMWYEWRMKLLEGLREVLVLEAEGMKSDSVLLREQEQILEESLPELLTQHEQLQEECAQLQQRAEELADCDQNEIAQARQQLVATDREERTKRKRMAELKKQSQELDRTIEDGQDAKVEILQDIQEAQRVREEYRGWSTAEVDEIKEQVNALETKHNWAISGAASSRLTMVYRNQIELYFDVAAFSPASTSADTKQGQNATIRLSYVADQNTHKPLPLTTEKRFFLQLIRAYLHSLMQHETKVTDLLAFVSTAWPQCLALSEEVHRLDIERITYCDIMSDERLVVKTMLLIPNVETKVNVTFEIGAVIKDMAVEVKLKARAEVAYGEQYREDKMCDFLKTKMGEGASWADAVRDLKGRLAKRGKK